MKPRKLSLRKETVRRLTDPELTQAIGGTGTSAAYIFSILEGCSGPYHTKWGCAVEAAQAQTTG